MTRRDPAAPGENQLLELPGSESRLLPRDTTGYHEAMAMTLRLTDEDDAALTAAAEREHTSKHELVLRALRAYTSGRQQRLEAATSRVMARDAGLLDRLSK